MAARPRLGAVLLVAFVVVPLVEIFALVQVGQVIGAWWTIALLVLDSAVGAWLVRREGVRAWRALRGTLAAGRLPAAEIADGALLLVGGTLLLTPGFVTDALGILLVLPLTRPLFRRTLTAAVARRLVVVPTTRRPGAAPWDARRPGPDVVRGDVVDDGSDET